MQLAADVAPFELRVVAPGWHSEQLPLPKPELLPPVVDVVLHRACLLRGIVSSQGRPVEHARVTIADSHLADGSERRSWLGDAHPPQSETDAQGKFELTVEGIGTVRLRAQSGAQLSDLTSEIAVKPSEDVDNIAIRFVATGSIEGTVTQNDGSPGGGLDVTASSDGKPINSVTTDDHGAFRFPGLPPGEYDLSAMFRGGVIQLETKSPPCSTAGQTWRCRVTPDVATHLEMRLLDTARCHLVLAIPSPPQSSWVVAVWIRTARPGQLVRDARMQGADKLDIEMIDPFDAEIRLESVHPGWPRITVAKQLIDRGDRELQVAMSAGRIEGTLAEPFAAGETIVLTWHGSSFDARSEVSTDAAGRFTFECAPAGGCWLARSTRPKDTRTIAVKSGETAQVDSL
jgi:hypothetical protein